MVTLREGSQQGPSSSEENEIVFLSGWWRMWLQNLLGQDPQPVPDLRGQQQQHQPGLTDRFDVLQEPAEGPEGPWWHQPPKLGC